MGQLQGVVGFLFDPTMKYVVLIKKTKPEAQKGLLNGVGGKIEPGELPEVAMRREFREETGLDITNWRPFAEMEDSYWKVHFFMAIDNRMMWVETQTEEEVVVVDVKRVPEFQTIKNLKWLLPLCFDNSINYCKISLNNE